jgi:hypothetical protein
VNLIIKLDFRFHSYVEVIIFYFNHHLLQDFSLVIDNEPKKIHYQVKLTLFLVRLINLGEYINN